MPLSLDFDACTAAGNVWANPTFANFDTFRASLTTLFEITTRRGWPTVMWAAVDSTPARLAPVPNNNVGAIVFFLAFLVVCNFWLLTLSIAMVVRKFTELLNHSNQAQVSALLM